MHCTAQLAIFRCLIATNCTIWSCTFQWLPQEGERADFSKNLPTSLFENKYLFRMNVISDGSISLDSTFKLKFSNLHRFRLCLLHMWIFYTLCPAKFSDTKKTRNYHWHRQAGALGMGLPSTAVKHRIIVSTYRELLTWRVGPACHTWFRSCQLVLSIYCIIPEGNAKSSQLSSSCQGRRCSPARHAVRTVYNRTNHTCRATFPQLS